MADEIERKFLVGAMDGVDLGDQRLSVRQGYLAVDGPVEVRVRFDETGARLTVKGGRGQVRTEVELELDRAAAEDLWPLTEGRRIEKVRHRVPIREGLTAEVDVYDGALAGLRTVEVEFATASGADAFEPPDWFGREVTGDAGWTNASLARHGPPARPTGSASAH